MLPKLGALEPRRWRKPALLRVRPRRRSIGGDREQEDWEGMTVPSIAERDRVELVGYHDLQKRPAFKIAMQEVDGRWFIYLSHFWHSGWTVMDVTDPARPEYVRFVPGPFHTETTQIQVADGLMIVSLEKPHDEVYGPVDGNQAGIQIYDVRTDPANPRLVSSWRGDTIGTHRNFYAGGDLAYLCAKAPGWEEQFLVILDIPDPGRPREVSRWW
jgi:hypothetical protein